MIKPSGGAGQRAPAASQAAPKLQNEFGLKSGKTRRIFVGVNVSFASLSGRAHIELGRALKLRDVTGSAPLKQGRRAWTAEATRRQAKGARSKSAKLCEGGINDAPFQAEVQFFLDYLMVLRRIDHRLVLASSG